MDKDPNDQITIAMATQPCRVDSYVNVVYELLPYCDRFCICFNGFDKLPDNLPKSPKIIAILANGKDGNPPDLGCNNKMYWLGDFPGYYATVDDDLIYPNNYISTLVNALNKYDKNVICSFHGHIYKDALSTNCTAQINWKNRLVYPFHQSRNEDIECHRLGMGVAMMYPSKLNINKHIYLEKSKNFGDDEITAVHAQINNIPLICVATKNVNIIEIINISRSKSHALSLNYTSLNDRGKYLESYKQWKINHYNKCNSRILVLSAGTKNLEYQYSRTNRVKQKYCNYYAYDYKFIELEQSITQSFHARKDLILQYLNKYDYVLWMDCDAWFNNFNISIDNIIMKASTALVVGRDEGVIDRINDWHSCYINSGILLFKSCDASIEIINRWKSPLSFAEKWMKLNTTLNDQPYLSIRIMWDKFVYDNTTILQPNDINKWIKYGYSSSTFILHMPGKKGDESYQKSFILEFEKWKLNNANKW